MDRFLSDAQIASLKGLIATGFRTSEAFYDITVQMRRRSDATGKYADNGPPLPLIELKFGLREVREDTGSPITTRRSDGDLKFWEGAYAAAVGDVFTHKGELIEITAVYPAEWGAVQCEVSLKQG